MNNKTPFFAAKQLHRSFVDGKQEITVLKNVSFEVKKGEQLAIIGSSGSGKSTLLHILATLDKPDGGEVLLEGLSLHQQSAARQAQVRNQQMGFVYQFHHLLAEFSALENTMMPLLIAGVNKSQARDRAAQMLQSVGLSHREKHLPSALSGGERQRVALARALVHRPALVLADEPTGNLDENRAAEMFDLMLQLNQESGSTLIVVTHDNQLASRLTRQLRMTHGRMEEL